MPMLRGHLELPYRRARCTATLQFGVGIHVSPVGVMALKAKT